MRQALIILAAALTIEQAAQAQQPKSETPPPAAPQWLTQCDNAGGGFDCRVTLTLKMQQTGQRLLAVVIRRASKTETPALMLLLPHGLFLPAGTSTQIDQGKTEAIPVQTCDQQGCYAGVPIPPPMLAALQTATTMTVTFQDLKKQTISVPVPLAGLGAAYQKLP